MLSRIFPKSFDNNYQGNIFGLIIFALISAVKFLMGFNISGLNPLISPEHILQHVDGIPLDAMSDIASHAVIGSSQAWAVLMLLFTVLAMVALWRYRSMIPFIFCLYLADHVLRKGFQIANQGFEIATQMQMGNLINWALIALILVGIFSSLYGGKKN